MLSHTASLVLQGITPIQIDIEVNGHQGVPGLILIGLPTRAVDEAKERITSSLHFCQIRIRGKRTVVNLAPADLKKTSSTLDLAIVVGLLAMYGEITQPERSTAFLGELALDGRLKPLANAVALILGARQLGFSRLIIPAATQLPEIPFDGIEICRVESLAQFLASQKQADLLPVRKVSPPKPHRPTGDWFNRIVGQAAAKRALQIAAAGNHHLLLSGPPGAGKTLLAQAIQSLLPPLSTDEYLEVLAIQSLIKTTPQSPYRRPFRAPHHSITVSGLVGGTAQFKPGEITLAHRGVLCLDELPEFNQHVLETLRQPLEQKNITLSNGHGSTTFPSDFLLIGTANPCPCGFSGSTVKACHCSLESKIRYHQKLSGPLIDRIDLYHVVDPWLEDTQPNQCPSVTEVLNQIQKCRAIQADRYKPLGYQLITDVPGFQLEKILPLSSAAKRLADAASRRFLFTLRGYHKLLRVSQTIADLESSSTITEDHLAEALLYRKPAELEQRTK